MYMAVLLMSCCSNTIGLSRSYTFRVLVDDNTGLNKVTSLKWLLLFGLQVAKALAVAVFPAEKGRGKLVCSRGKKTHICCLPLHRGNNNPWKEMLLSRRKRKR